MSIMAMATPQTTKQTRKPAPLTYFLGVVFVLFIGILIFAYIVTKHTNPVFLDQHGKPVSSAPQGSHAAH